MKLPTPKQYRDEIIRSRMVQYELGRSEAEYAAEAYVGDYASDEEFAECWVSECGYLDEVPEIIKNYFDYKLFARDLMMDHFEENGHYFHNTR